MDKLIRESAKRARIAMALDGVDLDEIQFEPIIAVQNVDGKVVTTLTATIVREITEGTATAIVAGTDILSAAHTVARSSASVRAEYRRQYDEAVARNPHRLPIHPDQVDLWAADLPWLAREVRSLEARRRDVPIPEGSRVTHNPSVFYTVDDDGIHLGCPCGWTYAAGHGATLNDLNDLTSGHIRNVTEEGL